MREESRSRADKIELGDELVKILVDSFVEMCQEVPRAKTAREQFLPPVARPQIQLWRKVTRNQKQLVVGFISATPNGGGLFL